LYNDEELRVSSPVEPQKVSERLQIAYDGVQRGLNEKKAQKRAILLARADDALRLNGVDYVGTLRRAVRDLRDALEAAPL